jgi:hypothetical protein
MSLGGNQRNINHVSYSCSGVWRIHKNGKLAVSRWQSVGFFVEYAILGAERGEGRWFQLEGLAKDNFN